MPVEVPMAAELGNTRSTSYVSVKQEAGSGFQVNPVNDG